ncbi:MAG: peroxidase-related enzyme [Acidobacteriaceae bacterium]|jgi:uncharacterized peroxidase-related enzyme
MSSATLSGSANQEPPVRQRAAPSSTNLPLLDELTASEEVRTLFSRYRERFDRTDLPGIVLCFATNSALLKGMLEIAENLLFGESLLSRRHKEMIATWLSRKNACPYCADSHGALLATHGGRPEVICALQQGDLNPQIFTSAELALLKFAAKVNANSPPVTRADVEAATRTGWTEAQVAETVHIAGLFAAFNRIANGFGLPSPYPDGL